MTNLAVSQDSVQSLDLELRRFIASIALADAPLRLKGEPFYALVQVFREASQFYESTVHLKPCLAYPVRRLPHPVLIHLIGESPVKAYVGSFKPIELKEPDEAVFVPRCLGHRLANMGDTKTSIGYLEPLFSATGSCYRLGPQRNPFSIAHLLFRKAWRRILRKTSRINANRLPPPC